jgi:hypothetical protein
MTGARMDSSLASTTMIQPAGSIRMSRLALMPMKPPEWPNSARPGWTPKP